jgi:hypothetical protein
MVRYLTTNGKSDTYACLDAFALMYRRANGTFYESITIESSRKQAIGSQRSALSLI